MSQYDFVDGGLSLFGVSGMMWKWVGVVVVSLVLGQGGGRPKEAEWRWRHVQLAAPARWERTALAGALYRKLVAAGVAWDEGVSGRVSVAKAKAVVEAELLSVAACPDTRAICAAARAWYRSGRSPYFVLLTLLEAVVFDFGRPGEPHSIVPWEVRGHRLVISDEYAPHKVVPVAGPMPLWRLIFGPYDYTRMDLKAYLRGK